MEDFSKLYALYSKNIYKYLLYLTGNHHLAEDLLQETFCNAFKAINKFQGKSKISTWLYTIARNAYLSEINKRKRNVAISLDELDYEGISFDMPDTILESKENMKKIITSITSFDEISRQVIVLRIISDFSFKEIGELLGKSENWARVTFYRLKIKLKQKLGDEVYD